MLLACKVLIEDTKLGCADLVFEEVCFEILAKARLFLDNDEFEELKSFSAERIKKDIIPSSGRRIRIRRKLPSF